jgi:Zn-dependent protease
MDWKSTLLALPGILLGLTIHEFCHALCAFKLGDNTARDQGRLTLNPLKHIDIIGFIFIIFAGFGWAKPVQFNPEHLKNYRRDKALIAAAGPLSNLLLGIIFIYILNAVLFFNYKPEVCFDIFFSSVVNENIFFILLFASSINFGLFIFNLLPIPPLDGSHIVFSGLNLSQNIEAKIRNIGMPLLLLIIIIQNSTNITIIPIGEVINAIIRFLLYAPK